MATTTQPKGVQPSPSEVLASSEPIAIVFSACRLPDHVNSPHQLWHLLSTKGIAASDTVPPSRFNDRVHRESSERSGTMTAEAMFIEDIDSAAFNAAFFNTSKTNAVTMNP